MQIFGDGATILKRALMNILAAGVHNHATVLDIADCSGHVAQGNKKDAKYIVGLFEPLMNIIDPAKKLFDLVAFDGASNIQKAGAILAIHFPRVTCIHGTEHGMALFFDDIFKMKELKLLTQFSRECRDKFGSTRHAPTAMFCIRSKNHNGGIILMFVKPCETRMAGKIISLLRLLRLRDALVATSVSTEFKKLKMWTGFTALLQKDELWKFIFAICRATYACMRVLCLADMKVPAMGKLYFYVLQADAMLKEHLPLVESLALRVCTLEGLMALLGEDSILEGEEEDESEDESHDSGEIEIDDDLSVSSAEEEDDDGNFDGLAKKIQKCWDHCRKNLVHVYARAGFLLSPNPTIMALAKEKRTHEYDSAIQHLIGKLLLDPLLVGDARTNALARLIDKFWEEHAHFWNRSGCKL